MPGANCAIVGCPACKGRNKGLSFHRLPKLGKNDEWRSNLIAKIGRQDKSFNPDKATICSRHFTKSCFDVGPSNKKTLRPGSLPTLEMPEKTIRTPQPTERKPPVLSHSVGSVMAAYGGPDCQETAKLILLADRFFDCLNGRAVFEGDHKRKPDLMPYRSQNDPRFDFLLHEFLGFLDEWRATVMERPGFTKAARNKMFLTEQTHEGLQITVRSFIEGTRFLLANGVDYVLSNIYCQDPIEEHFSRHRAMGRRADNPSIWTFGYQENKVRLQRSIALQILPRGNVRGKKTRKPPIVTDSPMKKRRY